ncbi:MAG: tRNA (adenosine(37)-N6)-threonylcarbamoyltransferase complex dimerization subunit type 1 TsaB [Alphaproteobacteria bacterium]|nr:tRNA (adenosine(37)-N6)-threonylcarbamoyltransferase complex dimerization subunit type 1 TsaB [Alphaproteobacteria bacterium]
MKILAVDTALGACSAAVLHDDTVLAHRLECMDRGHAEALAPMVQKVMRDAALQFSELDRLAVTTGPGTFTGQRVGLAFMRGLRIALKRPLLGVTTLEAMAVAAMDEWHASASAVLHDAKRGEVYAGLFTRDGTVLEPMLLRLEEFLEAFRPKLAAIENAERIVFAGTASAAGCELYRAAGRECLTSTITYPDAGWVAQIALRKSDSGEVPRPLYLRPPDARLPSAAG